MNGFVSQLRNLIPYSLRNSLLSQLPILLFLRSWEKCALSLRTLSALSPFRAWGKSTSDLREPQVPRLADPLMGRRQLLGSPLTVHAEARVPVARRWQTTTVATYVLSCRQPQEEKGLNLAGWRVFCPFRNLCLKWFHFIDL